MSVRVVSEAGGMAGLSAARRLGLCGAVISEAIEVCPAGVLPVVGPSAAGGRPRRPLDAGPLHGVAGLAGGRSGRRAGVWHQLSFLAAAD